MAVRPGPSNCEGRATAVTKKQENCAARAIGPPESLDSQVVYKLYRGVTGEINRLKHRIWVEFPALQLCWTTFDTPARGSDRVSLLDVSRCDCEKFTEEGEELFRIDISTTAALNTIGNHASADPAAPLAGQPGAVALVDQSSKQVSTAGAGPQSSPSDICLDMLQSIRVTGAQEELRAFGVALQQLLSSRDTEGWSGLEFIQRRLFQYLWKHQGESRNEVDLFVAQAVLAFNLDPRDGVTYLKTKLGKNSDTEVGEWLAEMSTKKGGLDPTILGDYFSRKDTLDVFKVFVHHLDFKGCDMVSALRKLFDTFKPGGEGQVITRILELFSEAYFAQWKHSQDADKARLVGPQAAYKDADTVLQVSVSLIMLNTGLHVAPKKIKNAASAQMTLEEYITNTRRLVGPSEACDDVLQLCYDAVKKAEISLQPMPRVPFSKLPVQPDIEGWLILVLSPQDQRRFWAVLALQRLYLFSDASDEPCDAVDLKDKRVLPVTYQASAREQFARDLEPRRGSFFCCPGPARRSREVLPDAMERAFEVRSVASNGGVGVPMPPAPMLTKLPRTQSRTRLALVAESPDLMAKWVDLITSGPY